MHVQTLLLTYIGWRLTCMSLPKVAFNYLFSLVAFVYDDMLWQFLQLTIGLPLDPAEGWDKYQQFVE